MDIKQEQMNLKNIPREIISAQLLSWDEAVCDEVLSPLVQEIVLRGTRDRLIFNSLRLRGAKLTYCLI